MSRAVDLLIDLLIIWLVVLLLDATVGFHLPSAAAILLMAYGLQALNDWRCRRETRSQDKA